MTRPPVLVWGSCWCDEEPTVLVEAMRAVEHAASVLDMRIIPVVFDARHNRAPEERQPLAANGIDILSHDVAAYPNKNFGVAMITAFAGEREADVVAVVDPDWAIDEVDRFVFGLLDPLRADEATGVLPDISPWAGRANRLVGEPAMRLFRPGMRDVVRTPFPGAVAARFSVLADVTTADGYRYDWGGEWTIADALWATGSVRCPALGMVNVRHRPTSSKAGDAFQIWRAVLAGTKGDMQSPDLTEAREAAAELGDADLADVLRGRASEQLAALETITLSPKVRQIVPMVLAPLAYFWDGLDTREWRFHTSDTISPYHRPSLGALSVLATWAAGNALTYSLTPPTPSHKGGVLGDWDAASESQARQILREVQWISR